MTDVLGGNAQAQIKSVIERVERLEQEKAEVAEQIKEVFAEAKGNGFDVKVLRKIVRLRKMDPGKRLEEEAITDLYLTALGEWGADGYEKTDPPAPAEDNDYA